MKNGAHKRRWLQWAKRRRLPLRPCLAIMNQSGPPWPRQRLGVRRSSAAFERGTTSKSGRGLPTLRSAATEDGPHSKTLRPFERFMRSPLSRRGCIATLNRSGTGVSPVRFESGSHGRDARATLRFMESHCCAEGWARQRGAHIRAATSRAAVVRRWPSGLKESALGQQFSLWTRSGRRVRAPGLQEGRFVGCRPGALTRRAWTSS